MDTANKERNEKNLVQLIMFRYFPYWPLFLALSIVLIAIASAYLVVTPPIYESTATILVKDERKGVENSSTLEALNVYTSKKIVENEIEVIKSKSLMRETVKKLNLSAPVYQENLLNHRNAYTNSPVVVELKDMTKVKETKRVDFAYDEENKKVLLNDVYYPINEWIDAPFGTIRFTENPKLDNETFGPFYFVIKDYKEVVDDLLSDLNVSAASKLATVVTISINDEVASRGNDILNTLLDFYNKASLDDKNHLAANTLTFVEDRIRLVESELDSLEHVIQRFKSSKGAVDLSTQGKLFLQNVGTNDQKLAEINMQTAMLTQIEGYITSEHSKSGIVTSTMGMLDESLSAMVNKLYDAESNYERLKNTTAENNPTMIAMKNQIQTMRTSVLEYVRNQRNNLQASLATLNSTNNKYSSVLQSLPQKERELLEVSRQQLVKNNVYTFLLQKREETALTFASTVADTRMVDIAESGRKPVAPKKIFFLAGALAFALFLTIAYVTLKELFNSKLLFRYEIESATRIPIVAEISYTGLKEHIVIGNKKKPFLTEQFRHLRAGVGLYGKSARKVLMVTSSISGEGKSFISANFATSLAQSGRKVLLIDFDLRNPKTTQLFGAREKEGLAEYLLGARDVEEVIEKTRHQNLFLLSAGQPVQNAFEILLNADLEELFDMLRKKFDYIIVDTPPVDPVTDAFLLSPHCDATLFVVRHNKTPKTMIQLLDENNKIKALQNVSLVFNGVRSRGLIRSVYGYGYGREVSYSYPG